jgi:hypothetical protein
MQPLVRNGPIIVPNGTTTPAHIFHDAGFGKVHTSTASTTARVSSSTLPLIPPPGLHTPVGASTFPSTLPRTFHSPKGAGVMKPMSLQNSVNQLPQRLLEDYEVSIHEILLQPDFDNEIIAYEAVLFLEILNFLKGIEYNKLQIM